jgi:hypothetical protein
MLFCPSLRPENHQGVSLPDVFAQREEPLLQPCLDVDPSHKSPRVRIPKAPSLFCTSPHWNPCARADRRLPPALLQWSPPPCSVSMPEHRRPLMSSHTSSTCWFMVVHHRTDIPELILDSLNLSRLFYFLRPGKHTPSRSNLMRRSEIEWPTLIWV